MSAMATRSIILRNVASASRAPSASVRYIQTSSPRRADQHSDGHHSSADDHKYDTHESWFTRPSRNILIFSALAYFAWPYLPAIPSAPASPSLSPETLEKYRTDPKVPVLTRLIAQNMTDAEENDDRTIQQLAQVARIADKRLAVQDAGLSVRN